MPGNEEDESDDDDIEFIEFDEETLQLLNNNDPSIANLVLGVSFGHSEIGEFDPHDVDWEMEASSIANNTHLKSLNIDGLMRHRDESAKASTEANVKAFYSAVARNRSIKHMHINGCRLIDAKDMFTILLPFFEHNSNLRSFDVANFHTSPESTQILVSALTRCRNTSLRSFSLHCHGGIGCNLEAKLITALNGLHNLKKLSMGTGLFGNGMEGCVALGGLLQNPTSKLDELDISWNIMNDAWATQFAKYLANSNKLKKLSMWRSHIITPTGWVAFFRQLQNSNSALEEIHLDGNRIDDEGLDSMILALSNWSSLKVLSLEENNSISTSGWIAFSDLLEHITSLENVNLKYNRRFNENCAIECVNALRSNTSLRALHVPSHAFGASSWSVLTSILCNDLSIEGIYGSNHTLHDIGGGERSLPPELLTLLRFNRGHNAFEIARQKILNYLFGRTNKIEALVDMDIKVLPHLMAWAGRDHDGFPLLYQLLQALPSLLDSDRKAKTAG